MYNVYLFDDNQCFIKEVKALIYQLEKRYTSFELEQCYLVNDQFRTFLNDHLIVSSVRNIYFIDLELKADINGLELAQMIRRYDQDGHIIFLSSHTELAQISYGYFVKAINFIDKGKDKYQDVIRATLEKIMEENNHKLNEEIFSFRSGKFIKKLCLSDVLYAETTYKKRMLNIHTIEECVPYNGTLKDLMEELPDYFIRCHKSFLINSERVKAIDVSDHPYQVVFPGGKQCDLSKRFVEDPMSLLME